MSALNSFTTATTATALSGTHPYGGLESGPWIAYYRSAKDVLANTAWGAVHCLGHIDADGIKLSSTPLVEDIISNAYGDTVIDQIFMGADVSLSFTLQQIGRATVRTMLNDWTYYPLTNVATPDYQTNFKGIIGQVGRPVTSYAGQLRVFPLHYQNPVFDNNGAGEDGAGWHYEYVTLMGGDAIEETMKAGLHTIPVSLRVLPFIRDNADTGSEPTLCYRRSIAMLSTS